MQFSLTRCLSQARINWEACSRKGIWHKNGGGDGGSNPDELTSSWIISLDASVSLTCSEQNKKFKQNKKHGRIPAGLLLSTGGLSCFVVTSMLLPALTRWYRGTYGMLLSLTSWYWLIRVILCKWLLNGKQLFLCEDVTVSYFLFSWQNIRC